jgi:hypothetical protein
LFACDVPVPASAVAAHRTSLLPVLAADAGENRGHVLGGDAVEVQVYLWPAGDA